MEMSVPFSILRLFILPSSLRGLLFSVLPLSCPYTLSPSPPNFLLPRPRPHPPIPRYTCAETLLPCFWAQLSPGLSQSSPTETRRILNFTHTNACTQSRIRFTGIKVTGKYEIRNKEQKPLRCIYFLSWQLKRTITYFLLHKMWNLLIFLDHSKAVVCATAPISSSVRGK